MSKKGLLYAVLFALVALVFQGTWTLAGTTGALTGRAISTDGAPIAGAKVTATSPSQTVTTTTNTEGRFSFVSLNPDTYAVTLSKEGYESATQSGVTVLADNTQNVTLRTTKAVRTIGEVTTRAAAELVRPGTTADVYSVNATTQAKVAALGGGGGLDQAYSAIASVPGVVVPPGQQGWFQTIHIRGGDFDQVGYEFDGVPVLRSYDNYPTTNASSLGQQELQVYTGASPANSESQGLSGYINQVIKSGTYPGFGTLDLGVGAPSLYNKAALEVGGATPNRNFSYFVGVSAADLSQRYINNSNGADVSNLWGTVVGLSPCPVVDASGAPVPGGAAPANNNVTSCYANGVGPGGYVLGGYQLGGQSHLADRENVLNLHFGLPHRNDAGKDDIQLLFDTSQIYNSAYSSATDFGLPLVQAINGSPTFTYIGSHLYTGQLDQPLPANFASLLAPYNFPSQPHAANGNAIPISQRDGTTNGQGIIKLQYQKNFGSNAYFRIYGYTFYSDWLQNGPNESSACCIGFASTDYELSNHTRGLSATFADQINNKNLINLEASAIGAYNFRNNNVTPFNDGASFAYLVDSGNPKDGICYNAPLDANGNALPGAALPVSCTARRGAVPLRPTRVHTTDTTAPALAGATCGGNPCEFFVVENGATGGANKQSPRFYAASLTDQFKASDKLLLNLGVREDRYDFKGSDVYQAPGSEAFGSARDFWFNAYNQDRCTNPSIPGFTPVLKPGDPALPCSDPTNLGPGFVAANIVPLPNHINSYDVFQPRFGATYTVDADTVLRFSAGKYAQAPNSAFQQYNVLQQDLAGYDNRFYGSTGNTTSRLVGAEISNNYDLSIEHHFRNTQASVKLTPYLRTTKNQIQNFFLDQKTSFVSGLNVGKQTADGVELQINDGDFNRNGLSGIFAYTYTHSFIKFTPTPAGTNVLDAINQGVSGYNAYTKACAGNTTNPACGGGLDTSGQVAAACYTSAGVPDPTCAAGSIANPYWTAPAQPLFDVAGSYLPFSTIPGGLDSATGSFITPNVASLVLNFKHDKLSLTPSFQFFSGGYYGAPFVTPGIDPAGGCAALPTGGTTGDARYPYGAAGGSPYDATTCAATLGAGIPDRFTGKFDNLGAFRQPNQYLVHLQIAYVASPRVTFTANLANIVDRCSGGDKLPWTKYSDNRVCNYGLPLNGAGVFFPAGNSFNPGSTFQPQAQFPYQQYFTGVQPFNAFLGVKVTL
ncbi:MAG: TonB-dependent receptor [Candidatus Eremiobacteraeota bacterium]|nr:TonB-dependent receptor [Candidatus Eremiobacteraeota bacterium]MBC5828519.1 TonB-dependent receptor [Candidatus Eremiobacteraeota bacterium]